MRDALADDQIVVFKLSIVRQFTRKNNSLTKYVMRIGLRFFEFGKWLRVSNDAWNSQPLPFPMLRKCI